MLGWESCQPEGPGIRGTEGHRTKHHLTCWQHHGRLWKCRSVLACETEEAGPLAWKAEESNYEMQIPEASAHRQTVSTNTRRQRATMRPVGCNWFPNGSGVQDTGSREGSRAEASREDGLLGKASL